jgi:carbonic anhydrase
MFIRVLTALLVSIATLSAIEPKEAVKKLIEGNKRFQSNKAINPNQDLQRREAQIISQTPFAIVVACSDSRVSPEILFDQGIGDIFVIRVAGNVIGPLEMESIEYAAKILGSSCIIVMGHEKCGAVDAVVQEKTSDIRFISQLIRPAIIKAKGSGAKDILETSIRNNAKIVSEFIKQSPIINDLIIKNKILVEASYYDFDTGFVEIL